MTRVLLSVSHLQQPNRGECLATCAAMVLAYRHVPVSYRRLLRLLKTTPYGAFSSNIRELKQLGITVLYQQGSLEELGNHLNNDRPAIAFVKTYQLPYWNEETDHAVVVVGLDDTHIYVNDPAFPNAPTLVSRGDFELAWLEWDELYAVLV
jgi:ABC-type bacteriocin/lantibiotic exporter with double-glycine peptidase domain